MNNIELKENKPHGTRDYPYVQYHMFCIKKPFKIPVHWHDELEIIYVEKGTLNLAISGQEYKVKEGSVFIVNTKELHFMGVDDLTTSYYTLLFPLEFISFQSLDALEHDFLMPLRSKKLLFDNIIIEDDINDEACTLVNKVIELNGHHCSDTTESDNVKQIQTRLVLLQFLELIIRRDKFQKNIITNNSDFQMDMLTYIQDNCSSKIKLSDLAERFHMSEKYISRYFKDHFNITITQYINHLRLSQAKNLLETTDESVTDIALKVGFSNVSHFIRNFKDNYHISPLKYRNDKN